MTRYIVRLVLVSCTFFFIFPMIPGMHFHSNFLHALIIGALFAFMGWIVESIAIAITAMLAIGTLGMALLILVPAWLFGFWLLPAVVLKMTAGMMPSTLTIDGWTPAIWGGLLMLCIGVATGTKVHRRVTDKSD